MKLDIAESRNSPPTWVSLASYVLIALACAYVGYALGKDISWDQRHFHYFMGFSALSDRFTLDYYPVSVQSYEVPYSYIPFYLLASSSLPDKLIVILLALLHAPALWAVWYVGGRLVGETSGQKFQVLGAWLSAALAAISPIFLSQLGNSFNDLPTAIPVLLAAALAMRVPELPPRPAAWHAVAAGLLLGAASALKLSNVVSAIGVVVVFILLTRGATMRLLSTALLGGAAAVSFVGIGGYWWWQSRSQIGIPLPFEPLLTQLLRSPSDVAAGVGHGRYMPVDLWDALLRPVWMMSPETTVYVDFHAPDARFFILNLLLIVALFTMVVQLRSSGPERVGGRVLTQSRLLAVSAGLVSAWVAWLLTSGNGRYLLPWFLLVGPVLVALLWKIVAHARFRFYALTLLFATQFYFVYAASQLRYDPQPWSESGAWYEILLPPTLASRPAIYFSMGLESGSIVFPSMHPGSSFISAGGLKMLTTDSLDWSRVKARLDRDPGRPIFMIFIVNRGQLSDARHVRPDTREIDAMVSGIGMRSSSESCEDIWVDGATTVVTFPPSVAGGVFRSVRRPMLVVACPIEVTAERDAAIERSRADAAALLDLVAQRCPLLFPDPQPFTFFDGNRWLRYFVGTDSALWLTDSEVGFVRHNSYGMNRVGNPKQIRENDFSVDCSFRRPSLPKLDFK
jgi:hypothetical protein